MTEKINPFNDLKKPVNWAQKANSRINENSNQKTEENKKISNNENSKNNKNKAKTRVAKSFKVYPGNLIRNFDKRVNKLQVHFDDKDFEKNFVDSGKYIMFLMSLSEKFELFELYEEVSENGEIKISKEEFKAFINKE